MDASDTTNRRKNRALFANRVIQQTTFDKGWKNRIILEEGVHTGAGAMTYAPNFYSASDGAVETTTGELDALIDSVPNKFPNPPTNVSAALVSGNVLVSFTAPRYQGETPVTSYTVISNPGGIRVTGTASPITVTGLTPGVTYTFTVIATNKSGNSEPSEPSNSVDTATVPDAPTAVSGVGGNGFVDVSFTAPAFDGGLSIIDYTVTAYDGVTVITTAVGSASPITVTGLTNGTAYTFTVKARNSVGYGAESAASAAVTPGDVPGIPTNFAVVPGAGTMKLYFIAPADDGGSAITDYSYSTNNGSSFTSAGTTSSPITVTGLVAGTSYDFKLKAVNVIGAGDPTSAVTAAALAAFDPVNISGMNTWFDPQVPASITATGNQVTAAADQSGSGNNFAASATGIITYDFPSGINGRPSFNFTTSAPTTSTYLYKDNLNLAPTNELSLFMVVYQTGKGSPGNCELFFTRNNYQYFDLFNNTYSTGVLSVNVGNATQQSTGVNIFSPLTPAVISVVITTSTVTIYVNGTVTSVNGTARGGLSLNDSTLDWAISGGAYRGYIGDVATYGAVTNTVQRQAMEGYLAWKWGLQSSLSGAHPYASAPPALALPAAPTSLGATAGDASASITFTTGSNGGSAITNYQYSTDNGATFTAFSPAQTSSPVTITGLSNGTTYNVKLKAVTDFGVGTASAAVSVTPAKVISGSPKVLILGNSAAANVPSALQSAKTDMGYSGTMTFTTKNVFGADSSYTGSDINTTNYDVVILYTDGGSTPSATLGANLDTYVSSGGNLIMGVFAWGNPPAFPGLTYTNSSTYAYAGTQSFVGSQVTTLVSHPILTGISGAISLSGSYTQGVSLTSGSTAIASYSNSTSFIAVRTPGSAKLVGINIYIGLTWSGSSNQNILRYLLNSIYWCIGSLT